MNLSKETAGARNKNHNVKVARCVKAKGIQRTEDKITPGRVSLKKNGWSGEETIKGLR